MIEEVIDNIYRIEIPLPGNPLKSVNSYVIKDTSRNLIIDTGLNRKECLEAMLEGLETLGVRLEESDFFVTHMHADHFALAGRLAPESSRIYFSKGDAGRAGRADLWERMGEYAGLNGFSEETLEKALHAHPGYRYGWKQQRDLTLVDEGDLVSIADYNLLCVCTPGHTPGHMCLYDQSKKILFSGDHILEDITPTIQCWADDMHPLREYLASLDKVYSMEVELVLPGHRRIFNDLKKRISELKAHHTGRALEAMQALKHGPLNAYQTASRMSWDIDCPTWELFPPSQKWFATGEAIAHLRFLEEEGKVERHMAGGKIFYNLVS
ncbi:MAG: MBL fold metallo-hydrolase [Desulfobacteraceae bacterium]|jgi:glyoxylase-like metal-dependent hydrolase (beta-lactamase superfamily II)|nr:MAG: MBL fold metallo-hydrolase [Desulfobacteraceae bacterium]